MDKAHACSHKYSNLLHWIHIDTMVFQEIKYKVNKRCVDSQTNLRKILHVHKIYLK